MEPFTVPGFLSTFVLAIALAACAGLRAWLPLFLACAASHFGLFSFGPSYSFLASDRALLLFGLATLVEVAADKIPALDHALDVASTVLRPMAGALLAASVFGKITDPVLSLALGVVVGAPTALVPHAAKATLRAASTVTTAGLFNPVLSVAEDFASVFLFAAALLVPLFVAMVVLVTIGLILRYRGSRKRAPQAVEVG
jgi:hypothetical protein